MHQWRQHFCSCDGVKYLFLKNITEYVQYLNIIWTMIYASLIDDDSNLAAKMATL